MKRTALAVAVMLVLAAPAVVLAARFVGTDGPDRIVGTPGPDTINGRGGADRIHGLGGNDRLLGKRGNDLLVGGRGRDKLFGGAGADRLKGGPGNDVLDGGDGGDRIVGGAGNDLVFGRGGNDHINVRDSKQDTVSCGRGTDTVIADGKDRTNSDCEKVQRPGRTPGDRGGGGRHMPPPATDIYNCDDFPLADGTTAQDYLDLYPSDPSGLDGNNDGVACEG